MDTSVSTPQAVATIISVEGQAFARNPAGQMRAIKAGDVLLEGDTVVTMPGGLVQLAFLDGHMLTLLPNETFKFTAETSPTSRPDIAEASLPAGEAERVIQALERGENIDDQLDPTAAGLDGGSNNSGNDFVRLLRIVEDISPLDFQFNAPGSAEIQEFDNANATSGLPSSTGTITDNDPVPTVSTLGNVTVAEGVAAVFTVNLSNASTTPTSFALALTNGSAVVGSDYTNALVFSNGVTYDSGAGTVSVPAGVTSFTVTVPTVNDAIYEPTE
ncbi:MAG: retention module-containing protein, partial [Thiobacillus sp.]|nr:retention module-containing protein [Thiobacillus sp.]